MSYQLEGETLTSVNDGIELIQNPAGLTFGTDALLLAAFVKRAPHATAAEFGSGSGIVSMLLATRNKLKHIYALEVQPYYADLTHRNLCHNDLDGKAEAVLCDVRDFDRECDVVFTNPPYMKAESGKRNEDDGKFAARHEVNGDIADFCRAAAKGLKFGGDFYAVYRPDRMIDLLAAMREAGIEPKRLCFVHPDVNHKPCLLLVSGKRGGKAGCDVLRPLLLTNPDGTPTPDAARIYETGDWVE
ncbi:MAG: methyltransferase [Clostridia bacterium]|nr:methyltransferase [Clostridia bacterium]